MERKYGILSSMNFDQLEDLAKKRGIELPPQINAQTVREKILQWEINKGLHDRGLRDLAPKVDYNKELARIQSELDELRSRLEIIEARQ